MIINYIEGPRCSGKTTKLLEQVKAYLTLYPKGKAIVISPTWFMSNFIHDMWDGDEDRVIFTSYDRYQKKDYRRKTKYYAIFIDEIDLVLNQLFDCNVLSVTREVEKTEDIKKIKSENEDFLNFLCNVINPNEMEEYLAMYNSKGGPER